MNHRNVFKRFVGGFWLWAAAMALIAPSVLAQGLSSMGNVDGVLTWRLGTLDPGKSASETVLFAYADSRDNLVALVERARLTLPKQISPSPPAGAQDRSSVAWIRNADTDFALAADGSFLWEGSRQALTGKRGGQLSQIGYCIHYNDGAPKRAGTSLTERGVRENLRLVEPVHGVNATNAVGMLETTDKQVQIQIRTFMGAGTMAAMEFVLANAGKASLSDLTLSVYANLESAHDEGNDFSVLEPALGGLMVIDPPTRMCVTMTGLERPVTGYSGTYESVNQLRNATGIPFDQWKPFKGIPANFEKAMARSAFPHPIAPQVDSVEPLTRTLSAAEAAAALERDWILQAEEKPLDARARQEMGWALDLAARLRRHPQRPNLETELAELGRLEKQLDELQAKPADPAQAKAIYLAVRRVKREITFKNPAINFTQVLFIDNPYPQGSEWPHQARHRDGMMAMPGGRLLLLDGLHPGGQLRKIAPDKPGSFWRPDLSFDARKVLFCYKANDDKAFHLYEIALDGTNLKQLTEGDYDDLDPIYLPDGHILFSSTRGNTYIRCMPYTYCYVLARCDADGSNIYLISQNSETDWLPTLLNDGRIIYSRWEYTDKALWRIMSLWTTNPDGTGTATFWGNQSVWPDHLAEPRPIPGSPRIMFTGLAHHNWFEGSIGIVDPRRGFNFPEGLTKVTADVIWPECGLPPKDPHEASDYHSSGHPSAYKTPYPLSEEDFLVSARRRDKFDLFLMDVHGNRELIYEAAHHIWHALPVLPREHPPVQADRVLWPGTGKDRQKVQPGSFYSADVYQGVPDLPRGKAKFLQVIQMDARTYSSWTRDARFSGPGVSLVQDDGVKRILGTVPIASDGSVSFKAPAGVALHFQLLDENYRAIQTMRSFTGLMPGERRGCVGCHESHSASPPNKATLALRLKPAELTPPPWGTASIGYERLVQPVLDKYCGQCHQGEGEARKKLDLTLRPGYIFFKEPYVTLVGYAQFTGLKPSPAPGIAGAMMVENFAQSDPDSYTTFRPMQHLSYKSKLIDIAMSGQHYQVKVDPVSLRQLIAWVDANCPYRGDEEIRQLPDPDFPGIELLAVRPKVRSAPIIERP